MTCIAITGAAGNLGQLSARHLLKLSECTLHLLIHKTPLAADLAAHPRVRVFYCDLENIETIGAAFDGVTAILHYASVLFKARPERFMATTNTVYFEHVVQAAKAAGVPRIVLTSFPHVEGETSPHKPSTDRLDGNPHSIHARTRLAEERFLYANYPEAAVVLRIGMVYGAGVLMPDAAHWLAKRRLLGVWRDTTHIHLISLPDYLAAAKNALLGASIAGTYNLGDEGVQSLQEYLDFACQQWRCAPPWRLPKWLIYMAAQGCEWFSQWTGRASPLTHDFLDIGRASYYGDTQRMRRDLLPQLRYPTMRDGAEIF